MFRWEDSGTGGTCPPPPQVFKSALFLVAKVPFCLTTLTISLRSKIVFNFGKNYHMSEQNFIIFEKNYDISGKILLFSENIIFSENITCREKIMTCPKKFLSRPPPGLQHFQENFLGALFFRKVPLETAPPQLFDASYDNYIFCFP